MKSIIQLYRRIGNIFMIGFLIFLFEPQAIVHAEFSNTEILSAFQKSNRRYNIQKQLPSDINELSSNKKHSNLTPPNNRIVHKAKSPKKEFDTIFNKLDLKKAINKLIESLRKRPIHEAIALLLLYIGLIGAFGISIVWLLSFIPRVRGMEVMDDEKLSSIIESNKPLTKDVILQRADMLFENSKFPEAIDTIFLGSISLIKYQLNKNISPSMTSREILIKIPMSERIQSLLTLLVEKVELIKFGNQIPSSKDYFQSRSFFCELVTVIAGGG